MSVTVEIIQEVTDMSVEVVPQLLSMSSSRWRNHYLLQGNILLRG